LPTVGESTYDASKKGSPEKNSIAHCVGLDVEEYEGDPLFWKAIAEFSSDQDRRKADPLDEPPEEEIGRQTYKSALMADLDGKKLVNAAGRPFLPPQEGDKAFRTLVLTRNEKDFDIGGTQVYEDCVNEKKLFGFDPGRVLCRGITANSFRHKGKTYYKAKYVFWIKTGSAKAIDKTVSSWRLWLLNYGQEYIDADTGELVAATTGAHRSPGELLNLKGFKLAPDAAPVYLDFRIYDQIDFGSIDPPLRRPGKSE
jgi:hypothetical protein